jgi:S1-C subfamily serine protease
LAQRPRSPGFREASRHETPETEKALLQSPAEIADRLGVECEPMGSPVVAQIGPGSPADKAGLRLGDRILRFAGRDVGDARALAEAVRVGPKQAALSIQRSGEAKPVELRAELEGDPIRVGITWRVDDAEPGEIILSHVLPGSPAAQAGLLVGDRILKLAGRDLSGEAEFGRVIRSLPGPIELVVEREGRIVRVVIHFGGERVRRAA